MAALSEVEKLEARYAENPDGRYFAPLADAYRKAGRVDDAIQVVTAGLTKHPDYLSAHIVLGRCLLEKKDDPAALAAFERVLGLDAENIIALKALAEISERTGNTLSARRWLQRLINVDAMNSEAADDLNRLGGPLPEEAEAAAEAVGGLPLLDLGEAAAAETAPMAALDEPNIPRTLERPAMSWSPPPALEPERAAAAAPTEPVPALEMGPMTRAAEPPAEMHEPVAPLELEHTSFEPPAPVAGAPAPGDVVPFDDQLAWGAGERHSKAVGSEDVAQAEAKHEITTPAIEFMGSEPPPGRASESHEPSAEVIAAMSAPPLSEPPKEAPPVPTEPGWSGVQASSESPTIEMAPMRAPSGGHTVTEVSTEPAGLAPSEAAADLPLIMPEDVTPADEMRRPSSKLVQMVSPEPEPTADSSGAVMVTETMGDLYLKQGFKDQAADVYRRLLSARPDDAGLKAKLQAIESPPSMGASALGQEAVGTWLKRIARAQLPTPGATPPPAAPEPGPSPMEQAFSSGESEPASAPEPVPVSDNMGGAPARPATDQYSLDQLFGSGQHPQQRASAQPPQASGSHTLGASFDEFFGSTNKQETVRPTKETSAGGRQSEDDLSAFNAWLHGLKR